MFVASGLVFATEHVRTANEYRNQPPFAAAWDAFNALESNPVIRSDALIATAGDGLRYRLSGSIDAGERAVHTLSDFVYPSADTDVESFRRAFATAQAISCTLDHPAMSKPIRARIIDAWQANTATLVAEDAPHLRAWAALTGLCAGILLDQPEQTEMAAAQFRALVDMVQPHGYVAALVGEKDGQTLLRTLQFVQAFVLTAETGAHHGLDLWGYDRRGVSVMTAALYPLYYYYYPEKWPWDAMAVTEPATAKRRSRRERARQALSDMTMETVQPMFIAHASFLEIVNRRAPRPIRAVTLILDELRPIVDMLGGGPLTLTHAVPPPPKRRGLFGR